MGRIVAIDDVRENLILLDVTLSKMGYEMRIFNNPILALKAVGEIFPDLILLDINKKNKKNLIDQLRDGVTPWPQ